MVSWSWISKITKWKVARFWNSTVTIQPAEAGIEELRTKLAGNALSMTNSNEFDIGKTIDCKRFSN